MSQINITNLTFAYDGSYDNIFENVSFQIDTDWRLGFTGRNGRGKTTFLNLLMGKFEFQGKISASVVFDYFPFSVTDKTNMTLMILEEINPSFALWELEKELAKLELDSEVLYRPFETLSNGEQTKVLLCVLFLKENHFLLIDEPTNHLDSHAREIVSQYLKSKSGFLLVSHDRVFLDSCIDHILSINQTNIEIQKGNFTSWYENKQLQDHYEIEQNIKLKREIKRLTETSREKAEWSDTAERRKIGFDPTKVEKSKGRRAFEGAKSKKAMKRSKVLEQRQLSSIEEKSKLLKNIETAEFLILRPLAYHSQCLIECRDISIRYGEKIACRNVSFCIKQGDRIALQGNNGSGKSSILKLLLGENIAFDGSLRMGSGLILSYVSQETGNLKGSLDEYANQYGIDESRFKTILKKLDFSRVQFEKNMEDFSGGQKKKVLIARSLCEQAHLYLWDEPLNFIDVFSRMQIEELLLSCQATLLFVEHDKAFTEKIATSIYTLE